MKSSTKKVLPLAITGVVVLALLAVLVTVLVKGTGKKSETEDTGVTMEDVQTSMENEDLQQAEITEEKEEETASIDETGENSEDVKEADETVDENSDVSTDLVKVEEPSEDEGGNASDNSEAEASAETVDETSQPQQEAESAENSEQAEVPEQAAEPEAPTEVAVTSHTGGHLIVIDPGHQSKAMTDKEPNGPGSSEMKMKVTAGTAGKTSGLSETQLNLTIGLMLRDELVNRGYTVMMTRETNDVSISNIERAQFANEAGAEAFIRIHANGSDNTSTNGALTICQTPSNPYNGGLYAQSRKLSDCVLDAYVASTGFKKQYVWETDTMTGINWSNVPSTIIEMGYMSNPTDDENMANPEYQRLMTIGIANGIDNYFAQ